MGGGGRGVGLRCFTEIPVFEILTVYSFYQASSLSVSVGIQRRACNSIK